MSARPTSNEVASQISKMTEPPEEYSVEWSSAKKWDFDATYDVKEFREGKGGKPILLLEGPRGGEFLVDSNPNGRPLVRYPKDGSKDRLKEIEIYGRQFQWRHQILKKVSEAASSLAD